MAIELKNIDDNAENNVPKGVDEMSKDEIARFLKWTEKQHTEQIRWLEVHQIVSDMLITVERRRTKLAPMKTHDFWGNFRGNIHFQKDAAERLASSLEGMLDVCSSEEEHYFKSKLDSLDQFIHLNRHHIEDFGVLVGDIDDILHRVFPDEDIEARLDRTNRRHREAMAASKDTYTYFE